MSTTSTLTTAILATFAIAAMDRVAIKQRTHKHQTAESIPPCPTISFRHPAYKDPDNILFRLPRLDHPEHTSTLDRSPPQTQTEPGTVTGVHHRTALLACQIVANNAFHGYLATDRDGQDVVVGPDGILTDETYWSSQTEKTATIPTVSRAAIYTQSFRGLRSGPSPTRASQPWDGTPRPSP